MLQNQPFGRGSLLSYRAWLPEQHYATIFADVPLHSLGRTEGYGRDLVGLPALKQGRARKADFSQMGIQTTVPGVQAKHNGLLGPPQSPNWVRVCLVATAVFLPVSLELTGDKAADRLAIRQQPGIAHLERSRHWRNVLTSVGDNGEMAWPLLRWHWNCAWPLLRWHWRSVLTSLWVTLEVCLDLCRWH